jgi:hypothetical protein
MKRFQHSLTPVLSISGLGDSLADSDFAVQDGEMVFVRSTRQLFVYENPSTQVPDGVTIVASNFGAGNWILVPTTTGNSYSGYYNTASAGALGSGRLLDVTSGFLGALSDGTKVWVRSVKDSYTWQATSAAVADGLLVVNPTSNGVNPGRFIRDQIASQTWATQLAWYIDPSNGAANDENSGLTALLPLKTALELYRRTKGLDLSAGQYNFYIISDIVFPGDALMLDVTANQASTFLFHGSATPGNGKTVLYTSVAGMTAKLDQSQGTNVRNQITDAAVPTGTWAGAGLISTSAASNKRIRLTTGTKIGRICWPQKDSGAGKVDTSALINVVPYLTAPVGGNPTRQNMDGNEQFVVESLVSVGFTDLLIRRRDNGAVNTFGIGTTLESLYFPTFQLALRPGEQYSFVGCAGVYLSDYGSSTENLISAIWLIGCHVRGGPAKAGAYWTFWGCHHTGTVTCNAGSLCGFGLSCIAQGKPLVLVNTGAVVSVGCAASFDSDTDGFQVHGTMSSLYNVADSSADAALLWGTGATKYGVRVRAGCSLCVRDGTAQPVVTGGTAPNDFFLDPAGTARAWDDGAGVYQAALSTTWAHLFAALGAGTGFGKNCFNLTNGARVVNDTHSP